MYQDWMDAVPLLVEGCYYNNINQAQAAVEYYEREGMQDMANYWKDYIIEERNKKQEEDSLTLFGKIIKRIMYK